MVSKFWQLGRQAPWEEERRCFTRFVHENEKELGPGCRVSGESIVLSVGRVKVPEFTKEVLQESEEGVPTSFDNRVGDAGDARGLSRREIGNDAEKRRKEVKQSMGKIEALGRRLEVFFLCVLLPLENLLWAKLRDYAISRVNPNPRQAFLM